MTARKRWISGTLEPRGAIIVDEGAAEALRSQKSLLPAGVKRIEGNFARGDAVLIRDELGAEIGRGLVAYDAMQAMQLIGKRSKDIRQVLGIDGRAAMVHKDDLVITAE